MQTVISRLLQAAASGLRSKASAAWPDLPLNGAQARVVLGDFLAAALIMKGFEHSSLAFPTFEFDRCKAGH